MPSEYREMLPSAWLGWVIANVGEDLRALQYLLSYDSGENFTTRLWGLRGTRNREWIDWCLDNLCEDELQLIVCLKSGFLPLDLWGIDGTVYFDNLEEGLHVLRERGD